MKIKYKVFEELNLIIINLTGQISFNHFINFIKDSYKDQSYNPKFNLVFDFRNAKCVIDNDERKKLFDIFNSSPYSKIKRKMAFLALKTNQVANLFLFEHAINNEDVNCKTFITIEGLLNWFQEIKFCKEEFDNLLNLKDKGLTV